MSDLKIFKIIDKLLEEIEELKQENQKKDAIIKSLIQKDDGIAREELKQENQKDTIES